MHVAHMSQTSFQIADASSIFPLNVLHVASISFSTHASVSRMVVVMMMMVAVSLVSAMIERQGFCKSESGRVSDRKDGCDLRVY